MQIDFGKITRLEVIDDTGRVYTNRPCYVAVSVQDNERTLKIFVTKPRKADANQTYVAR